MINFLEHGEGLVCFAQIGVDNVKELADAGFKSIICNRPDSEPGTVPYAEIEAVAKAQGLAFAMQAVSFSTITKADGVAFAALIDSLPQPVAAYCRTGRRSAALWVLGRADARGKSEVLDSAEAAGCPLDDIAHLI